MKTALLTITAALALASCATDRDFYCPTWPMFLSDNNSPYYLLCTLPEGRRRP